MAVRIVEPEKPAADPTQTNSGQRRWGLRQVTPASGVNEATIDIIAIHGLETQSPRTWEFHNKSGSGPSVVNWLADADMLPEAVPKARILTYDWNASYFEDSPVKTLLGHADTLLGHLSDHRSRHKQPIIFVASCFGGLVLAEAINRAAQHGSQYDDIIMAVAGIIFLATPFRGSDASKQAQWQVVVGGIMGNDTSTRLVDDLEKNDKELLKITKSFAEIAGARAANLPLYFFFETRKTEMLRKFLSPSTASKASLLFKGTTKKILVSEQSACLDTFPSQGLEATHSGMTKFSGPTDANFTLVKGAIKMYVDQADIVVASRKKANPKTHFLVPFGRNRQFVGRKHILDQLLELIPPSVEKDNCQRTVVEGLGGIGKTQIAIEAAFKIRDDYHGCSVFWVPAIDMASFENAYREVGVHLDIPGINDVDADVKPLVKTALEMEDVGEWLMIVDNADNGDLLFRNQSLSQHLPFNGKGSILFTTRSHEVAADLHIPRSSVIEVEEMDTSDAIQMLHTDLEDDQKGSTEDSAALLDYLANLPLAIRQASAYMFKTGMSVTKYLDFFKKGDETRIKLLSKDFEDRGRYKNIANPITTTWLVSFEQISRDAPLAAEYLKYISFLSEKAIPATLLPMQDGELEAEEALATLKAYAFITQRQDSGLLDIHRLVRLVMRHWLISTNGIGSMVTMVIQRLAIEFPWPQYENKAVWLSYLPHAHSALLSRRYSSQPDNEIRLTDAVAACDNFLGKYQAAETVYRQTLVLAHSRYESERFSEATISILAGLAISLLGQQKIDEAEKIQRQALELCSESMGSESPVTLSVMNSLAIVLTSQRKNEEAQQLCREVLGMEDRLRKSSYHPGLLDAMSNLAHTFFDQGGFEEGEQMLREVLDHTRTKLGQEHPRTIECMSAVAIAVAGQDRHGEAALMLKETWELSNKVHGPEHPYTIRRIYSLALVYLDQGEDIIEAERLLKQVLELGEETMGPEDPLMAAVTQSIQGYVL